ncbi:hypothetical protein DPEC_G00110400 [Dallia pectoralis]|uniref:Uncharacterized protein n=2 Tax=Dallia pectoralis TaxID=75939 RepID=A0ACC2GSY3_DALPE|nr:hypothetical protein DPEC_G00108990 [Dallia pectoralis]KAJ8006744.1 hypothetical protein DPEC_G00110400 [Dallia pectoralis]
MHDQRVETEVAGTGSGTGHGISPTVAPSVTATMMMPWVMGGPWVPTFSGTLDCTPKFGEWRAKIETYLRAQGLPADQRVDFVLLALEGDAKREVMLLPPEQRNTDIKIFEFLASLYAGNQSLDLVRAQFFECRQKVEEGVGAFILRFRELHHRWQARMPGGVEPDHDRLQRAQFIRALQPGSVQQELQREIRRRPAITFREVCTEAKALAYEIIGEMRGQAILLQGLSQLPPIRRSTRQMATPDITPAVDALLWQRTPPLAMKLTREYTAPMPHNPHCLLELDPCLQLSLRLIKTCRI